MREFFFHSLGVGFCLVVRPVGQAFKAGQESQISVLAFKSIGSEMSKLIYTQNTRNVKAFTHLYCYPNYTS
jgi:hypothetical protein